MSDVTADALTEEQIWDARKALMSLVLDCDMAIHACANDKPQYLYFKPEELNASRSRIARFLNSRSSP